MVAPVSMTDQNARLFLKNKGTTFTQEGPSPFFLVIFFVNFHLLYICISFRCNLYLFLLLFFSNPLFDEIKIKNKK